MKGGDCNGGGGWARQTEAETSIREHGRGPELHAIMPRGGEDKVILSIYLMFRKYLILLS